MAEKKILGFDLDDPEQEIKLLEKINVALDEGKTLREALELSTDDLEQLYAYAYGKYQYGDYKAAVMLFRYLFMLDQYNYRYTLGLAAALHKLEDYQAAANSYVLAALYEPNDPVAYFHGADCLIRLDNISLALSGLETAISLCEDKSEFEELKERAKLIKATLEKKPTEEKAPAEEKPSK